MVKCLKNAFSTVINTSFPKIFPFPDTSMQAIGLAFYKYSLNELMNGENLQENSCYRIRGGGISSIQPGLGLFINIWPRLSVPGHSRAPCLTLFGVKHAMWLVLANEMWAEVTRGFQGKALGGSEWGYAVPCSPCFNDHATIEPPSFQVPDYHRQSSPANADA